MEFCRALQENYSVFEGLLKSYVLGLGSEHRELSAVTDACDCTDSPETRNAKLEKSRTCEPQLQQSNKNPDHRDLNPTRHPQTLNDI